MLVTLNRVLYKQDCDVLIHTDCDDLSHVMRKQDFCLCENIGADQLCSNCEADQRSYFRYMDSTIPLLRKSEISSFYPSSVAAQAGLCGTWSETLKTGFLVSWFIYLSWLRLLAHLSRRLTGELIVYPCSVVRRPSVRRPSVRPSFTFSKIFSSETAWPIKAKLHVEHP